MNAGLPGTGLGGLFYIASALFMPVHRMRSGAGHDGRSWTRVLAQAGIAAGILAALFATGWLLGLLLVPATAVADGSRTAADAPAASVLRWVVIAGTAGLLALLLVIVEVAGLVLRRRQPRLVVSAGQPRTRGWWRRRLAAAEAELPDVA